jgi:hypothetical protein
MPGFGPKEIGCVLRLTDELCLHREAVRVPLSGTKDGDVKIEKGKLLVLLPEVADVQEFLAALKDRVRELPLFDTLMRAPDPLEL